MPPETGHCAWCRVHLERMTKPGDWDAALEGIDAVVNCVGILRPRPRESYDQVHHRAPAALAAACGRLGAKRLIHVSALGLHDDARSGFIRSKLAGERALSGAAHVVIVRPSLLDGEGGFGARWIRRVASWPVHFVPDEARGRIAVIDVHDAAAAIAILCEPQRTPDWRVVELGGGDAWSMGEYLAATRAAMGLPPAKQVRVPAWCARLTSRLCDLLHWTPFSFGHLELLRSDNLPNPNRAPVLLGRAPARIAEDTAPRGAAPQSAA